MTARFRKSRQAVTLTELLVVLAIISLLATIAVPVYIQKTEQARIAIARQETREIASAQDQVFLLYGYYVPIHLLDTLPNLNPGDPGYGQPRDDFDNYFSVTVNSRAMDPLANPAADEANPPFSSTGLDNYPRLANMIQNWTGPFLNAQRLDYGEKSRDRFNNASGSLTDTEIARALVLDPWGRPYRLYSPLGVVGSEDEQSDTNPFQRTSGQYRLGYDDGVMRSTADTSRRFDRWAVVSYGRDGISDRTKTGAGNESIRDDVFYVFGFVPGESFYKAF